MSKPARSIFVFGVYLLALGAILVAVPNLLLGAFGLPATQEVWIRVVGMLVLILGCYDVQAARQEWDAFIRMSVPMRLSVIVFFGAFVAAGYVSPRLLLFGAVDFAAAAWTWLALRSADRPALA
ncbi:MAG TPA: hypothetical protein VJT67_11495 [Longimicrobiaceae bacterium]|nr:hypothetical protein [Longimicrobiaceae bacterium]